MVLVTGRGGTGFSRAVVLWFGLCMAVLQAERLYLVPQITAEQPPSAGLFMRTLAVGFGNDVVASAVIVGIVLVLAAIPAALRRVVPSRAQHLASGRTFLDGWKASSKVIFAVVAGGLVCLTTADVCYFAYNRQHFDFVFFEYLDELAHGAAEAAGSQAAEQTAAELDDVGKWAKHVAGLWAVMALCAYGWILLLRRGERFAAVHRRSVVLAAALALALPSAIGAVGLSTPGSAFDYRFSADSEAYYSLSQNPLLFSLHPLRDAFLSKWAWSPSALPRPLSIPEAIREAQTLVGNGHAFPFPDFPLVREEQRQASAYFGRRTNIILIFIEGLDRRFVDRTWPAGAGGVSPVPGDAPSTTIRLTPFLDRLKNDSVYFEHFFANGVQTARGLFSTLCSALPRQGTAAIKTRYQNDYLCFPRVLQQAGYATEMVAPSDSDSLRLEEFLSKNGIDRYYDQRDFASRHGRVGIGLTDTALFDIVADRVEALQNSAQPFFLAALTSGTHHPFHVPADHPDVKRLLADPDPYPAALRYCDLALERFFSRLQSQHLLDNTMVIVLGDHGRHEPIGTSDFERQVGHFLSPLYIWADESLRRSGRFIPRSVSAVTSQIDIGPTVLTLNGLLPRLHPFLGQDFSCLLGEECMKGSQAYMSSVYDDLIGVADRSGIWLYSFRRNLVTAVGLDLEIAPADRASSDEMREKTRAMTALYLAFNSLLEQNRIWSSAIRP